MLESATYLAAARRFYEEQFCGGSVDVTAVPGGIAVSWSPAETDLDPLEHAVALLRRGEHRVALPMLQSLLKADPDHRGVLFNLGMAESDFGKLDDALSHLKELVRMDPTHAHGWVALGVAHERAGQTDHAIDALQEAVRIAPGDPYARRNLGALLGKKGLFEEAVTHLDEAVRHLPTDQQALFGLASALVALGGEERIAAADSLFARAIDLDPDSKIAGLCQKERSRLAHDTFRSNAAGQLRMDAVMYCLAAMDTFANMSNDEVRTITFEIALLGTHGLDVNDPAKRYQIRSLPGRFSGLQLVSIEYVGFKLLDPSVDLGFDLSEEYSQAQTLFSHRQGNRP